MASGMFGRLAGGVQDSALAIVAGKCNYALAFLLLQIVGTVALEP